MEMCVVGRVEAGLLHKVLRNMLVSYCAACLYVRGRGENYDRVASSSYTTVEITVADVHMYKH